MFKKIFYMLTLCLFAVQFAAAQLPPFVLTVTSTDESCTGNGSLDMQATGTNPAAVVTFNTYQLPNLANPIASQTTSTLTGLVHGDYRVIATQKLGNEINSQTVDITILDIITPLAYTLSGIESQCVTGGTITANVVAGNPAMFEIIAGPVLRPLQTSNVFTGLPAGTYQIRVFDDCGQALVKTYILFSEFQEITVNPSTTSFAALTQCNSITINNSFSIDSGGVIPYPLTFTYTIYPPNGGPAVIIVKTVTSGTNVSAVIPYYNGVPYNYTVSTTGVCGTEITLSGEIDKKLTVSQSPVPAPCDEFFLNVNVSNFIGPYTLSFITAPAGFIPGNFSAQFPTYNAPNITFGSIGNSMPGGIYKIKVVDACGNTATHEINLQVPEVIPSVKIESEPGCVSNFATVSIQVPSRGIVSASMTTAPSGANLALPANMMAFYNSATKTLVMTHLISGDYVIIIVDDCGKQYTIPFKVPYIDTSNIITTTRPDCGGETGSVVIKGQLGVAIASAQITAAPASFASPLPFNVTSNLNPEGVLVINNLVPGSYSISAIDICGKTHIATINVEGTIVTEDTLDITRFCGAFKFQYTHTSNTNFNQKFWLQRLDPVTNTWGHPQTFVEYPEGSEPDLTNSIPIINGTTVYNVTTFGDFRIIQVFESMSTAANTDPEKCFVVTNVFNVNEDFSIKEIVKISCDGTSSDIKIISDGVAPLIFRIIEKNGLPFLIDNGDNNIFTGLEPAIYKFQVQQSCGNIVTQIVDISNLPEPFFIEQPEDMIACDEADMDNQVLFDLSLQNAAVVGAQDQVDFSISYHTSIADALSGTNPLPYQYLTGSKTLYVRLRALIGECIKTTSFKIKVKPYPKLNMKLNYALCEGSPITITADAGMTSYLWSTGETTQSIVVSEVGTYTLEVQRAYGTEITCSAPYNVVVTNTTVPQISEIISSDWTYNDNSFSVVLQSGNPEHYLYSLDNITFQTENTFSGLAAGTYQVFVKNIYGCGDAKKIVHLLNYPHFFTPNGDGINDTWHVNFAKAEPNIKVYIFDRYGKLIKELLAKDYGWDGTLNGKRLPSTDYWFMVQRENGQEFRGHFSMKR